ncbi:hypothetical protein V492_08501 [Pseudogymnoascus sp. VKM F-4246]|nr:hypothetical protein V492_08501 [Pseudogymnoascus sp. VKM F-4246]
MAGSLSYSITTSVVDDIYGKARAIEASCRRIVLPIEAKQVSLDTIEAKQVSLDTIESSEGFLDLAQIQIFVKGYAQTPSAESCSASACSAEPNAPQRICAESYSR